MFPWFINAVSGKRTLDCSLQMGCTDEERDGWYILWQLCFSCFPSVPSTIPRTEEAFSGVDSGMNDWGTLQLNCSTGSPCLAYGSPLRWEVFSLELPHFLFVSSLNHLHLWCLAFAKLPGVNHWWPTAAEESGNSAYDFLASSSFPLSIIN